MAEIAGVAKLGTLARRKYEAERWKLLICSGERGRNRTYNLLIKRQLLCQLSYAR